MTQPCDPDTKNPGDQLRALQRAKATLLESSSVLTAVTNLLAEPLSRCVAPKTRGLLRVLCRKPDRKRGRLSRAIGSLNEAE
jgi:hypothetical protein